MTNGSVKKSKSSGLVVLEGRWFDEHNISVKSLFDVLIDINFDTPHGYYFETFANAESLRDILKHVCGKGRRGRKYLYIGAHGDEQSISGSVKDISRTEFRNSLKLLGGQMRGVFLASCLFGRQDNAEHLLRAGGVPSNVGWIAGYGKSVDWIQSAVLDMLFWNTLFKFDNDKRTPGAIIEETCGEIMKAAPGLITTLQFQVFARPLGHSVELRKMIDN